MDKDFRIPESRMVSVTKADIIKMLDRTFGEDDNRIAILTECLDNKRNVTAQTLTFGRILDSEGL